VSIRFEFVGVEDLYTERMMVPLCNEGVGPKISKKTPADSISHRPWNKGKLSGAKPPLLPKCVWSIRTKLQIEGRVRELAMFNLAIDSKLRGCDVVAIKVEDVAAGGYTADRATINRRRLDSRSDLN
jgi:hypothetical protein